MRIPRFLRRRRNRQDGTDLSWSTPVPGHAATGASGRYLRIPEIDRWRAINFDMPPAPQRGDVLQRIRQFVEGLGAGLDEGSGDALDLLVQSWVASWIASVNSEYIDHCSAIDVHHGQAAQWLCESEQQLEFDRAALLRAEQAHELAERRLRGPSIDGSAVSGATA